MNDIDDMSRAELDELILLIREMGGEGGKYKKMDDASILKAYINAGINPISLYMAAQMRQRSYARMVIDELMRSIERSKKEDENGDAMP